MCAPLSDDRLHNDRTASAAGAFRAVERSEAVLEPAARPVDALVHHVNARPSQFDGAFQNEPNGPMKTRAFRERERLHISERMQASVPE